MTVKTSYTLVCDFCGKRKRLEHLEHSPHHWSTLSSSYGHVSDACPRCRDTAVTAANFDGLRIWPESKHREEDTP